MARISLTFCRHGNFGDKLNLSLGSALGIGLHRHAFVGPVEEEVSVLGIGTVLTPRLQVSPRTRLIVFGSGFGMDSPQKWKPPKMEIRFLRGPVSCAMLKLDPAFAVSDGAYLFGPRFREMTGDVAKSRPVGYIPHHLSGALQPGVWRQGAVGAARIDPMQSISGFVREVAACERIVTEALHGAIVADALRIPFTIVQTSPFFNSFKWLDWLSSMGLELRIGTLGADESGGGRYFQMSSDARLGAVEARIAAEFQRLQADLRTLA